jgi:lipoteichoic acid synthase
LFLCAVVTAGCGRSPAPPYPLAFTIDSRAPRVLQAGQEITLPVGIGNTGQRGWEPSRIHLSYHWLWLFPRELATPSRPVPYHDGIRTELTSAVGPGGRAALRGRVLAPSLPGLYWLQWDMVEEGVTWFAQVAPRQRRTLILIVPPLAWLFAPLPLLIALAGALTVRHPPEKVRLKPDATYVSVVSDSSVSVVSGFSGTLWLVGSADVAWCIACLFAKPLLVFREALLEPTAVAYWLTTVAAVVPPLLIALVLRRRVRAWVLFVIGALGSAVLFGDVVYYHFFGDVLSAPALLAARQTSRVWGSIRSVTTLDLLWLVIDLPVALWLVIRVSTVRAPRSPFRRRALAAAVPAVLLACGGIVLSAPRTLASTPLDQMFRDRAVVEQLGPFGYHAYDGWNYARTTWLRPPHSEAQWRDAVAWFAGRASLRAGSNVEFGVARNKNLIVIQVESLQDFVVDFKVGEQEVMPRLSRWASDSLRFTNVSDQTSEGRTSDAEFVTLASLLPLDHGAAAFRYPGNHYVALPRVLTEHGYHTISAVPFEPGFWNRQVMHPAYGFQQTLFEPQFQITEQIGWGLNDRDFLQQMVPHLEQSAKPFVAWLITLSLHHPFEDFPARHKVLKLGALEGSSFGNYLHTMRFFDDALESFKESLAKNGLLNDSVIVVFGDHDAGFPPGASLAKTIGIGSDEVDWVLNDRVPLFVRVPGTTLRGIRETAAGQTDFAPTLLALLGVDPAPLPYVGRNLLGALDDSPLPRPYGDWLNRDHLFLHRSSEPECYNVVRRRKDDSASCRDASAAAKRERDLSRLVVADDLQEQLRVELAAIVK